MTVSQARLMRLFARWHRRIALLVALWLILLAISGVLINHAHDWKLDSRPLPASLQRLAYGIEGAEIDCGPNSDALIDCASVFARMDFTEGYILLSANDLYLLTGAGELLEKLTTRHLGLGVLEAGLQVDSLIYLRDAEKIVRTTPDLVSWETLQQGQEHDLKDLNWRLRQQAAGSVSWERLLLDVHAARFLGVAGKAFTDLMAALILLLAVSGIWLYRIKLKNKQGNINGFQ